MLREAERGVRFEKADAVASAPNILEVKDVVSGKVNETLTPGGVIQLWGSNLKIAGDNEQNGLWFAPETGEAVKAEIIVSNKPSSVIAMAPASLTSGGHTLRIVTQHSGSNLLKTPRIFTFGKPLTVA